MSPSASGATSLPSLRASWPRTWAPQHLSSLTRPASSTLSPSSRRKASLLTGMWQGHLLPFCTEGPGLLSGWDKAQLLGTWLSGSPGQCFIPMQWLVTGGLGTPCLPGPWVVAAWGQPSPAVPMAPLSPLPSSLKNELEKEIPLATYQYAKSLKDTILLGPNAKGSSSWAAMRSVPRAGDNTTQPCASPLLPLSRDVPGPR